MTTMHLRNRPDSLLRRSARAAVLLACVLGTAAAGAAINADPPPSGADTARANPPAAPAASTAPAAPDNTRLPSFPGGAASPSLFANALPFQPGKPLDAADLANRLNIDPNSSKGKLLADWTRKVAADPDINRYYLSTDSNPATAGQAVLARTLGILDGMMRISQQDREQLTGLTTRALDNAPADCGGMKNLQQITTRYLSFGTESDADLDAQLQAMFNLIKQSTQTTAPPQLTPGQRLRGQLAVSVALADALKREPSAAEDLGMLMSGRQAELSPEAWCNAMRVYRKALDKTPQPARDWAVLAELDTSRRSAALLINALKNLTATAAARQAASAPPVFDYAERVRQRVQPNIVWNGKTDRRETVLEVRCTSTGNLESVKIVRSSGDRNWDKAAVEAVKRSDPMPRDENGETPRMFTITLRPGV
ncbi:energy transducer TonB [Burkholderia sp. SRS-W-2-2016]|uniref:energy transducer TonB n=1 Tax=Burkholderia sp. SRS-W-2-2016 TaxID=1926878 RepID=UPI0009FAE2E7|nr:energy transducer TonB [Burkholderia sp. SRS-W-2-2016]